MSYVGGIRLACINESFYQMVNDSLDARGWLTSNPGVREDVTVINGMLDTRTEITPNKVSISFENMRDEDLELGSSLTENRWSTYIDIFAENEFMGQALAGDVFDILRGKIASIGRTDPSFIVYDYQSNAQLFNCNLENIEIGRVRDWNQIHNKYWWVVGLQIVDTYAGEE